MYNILVCDDDKEIVEAIEIYLSQEGYHILKAYDGQQALKILESEEIHLLILDVMMGSMRLGRSGRSTASRSLSCRRSPRMWIRSWG